MMATPTGADPRLLLFDLGGVLVEYSGLRDLAPLLPTVLSPEDLRARLLACPHMNAFELGALPPDEFAAAFVRDWGIRLAPDRFLAEFRSWTRCLLPGARELLQALRPRFRVAALSNSNATHWERNLAELGIGDLFDALFSSHELRLHKPDPAIYRVVLERLGVTPAAVIFFDDSAANVAAAHVLGLRAYQVEGVEQLRACLDRLQLLR